ncbi:MAG: 50S ribosomal protein L15 [Phycisphaerae bacterium]
MKLDDILGKAKKYKKRKRVGRGESSGQGKTSGRGHKGFGQRSGYTLRPGFEGGQSSMIMRFPKRGFSNADFRRTFQIVNVATLDEKFEDGAKVDGEALAKAGVIEDAGSPVKILGNGDLSKKLTVVAEKFSKSASEKIEKAGGSVEPA